MIQIMGSAAPKIGFASHQNAVPVLRELEIVNASPEAVEDLELTVSADPPFIERKRWKLDRINGESTLHVTDREIRLNGTFLGDLSESLRGQVRLRLTSADQTIAEEIFQIELLARGEWGGAGTMAELLPAFVMPNDPAVDQLLKAASDVLRRADMPDAIDGYRSGSRKRVWQMVSAIWSAVAGVNISYALPPASFEAEGQKIRTPRAILEGRVGTCLDTALLFAAVIEQAGLNPLLILTRGHAFVGVWLQPQEFSELITEDAGSVRKRFDLDELLMFETTLITSVPVPRFDQAVADSRRQLSEENETAFIMAVDIRRARMQRITPLAASRPVGAAIGGEGLGDVSEGVLEAPDLPEFDVEIPHDVSTPADRVMLWQRKLLDLTTRNRLLHLPTNAKIVGLLCPDPALLEDLLAAGRKIKIRPLPDLEVGGRDLQLYAQQTSQSLEEEYARAALDRGEVLSAVEKVKLESSLIDLYRKARSDLEEGGANTLFLALGFLKWKKAAEDPKQYRAPLILLPVKLERKSALSGVTMTAHEDEARFNLTLLELLRHDFELNIPSLEGRLPGDESGVDVRQIWTIVRRAVRDLSGFEVVEDVVIGTFSFAKYLMWKDLVDREGQLKDSPIVKHLIERGAETFQSRGEFPAPEELDQKIDPASLFAPLPADSSQISAIVASGNGCDFVLDGPPGTGKSQTIANMIAHNLALGRRVLFVAEKRAALEVVYRRLEEKGIGEFCLELHSNKTAKIDVLKQLERAWDARDALSVDEWRNEANEVRRLRDSLNGLVQLLHAPQQNGLTLHQAIGRVVRDADEATPRLTWPEGTVHDIAALARLRDIAKRLGIAGSAVADLPAEFSAIGHDQWTNGWQEAVVAAAGALPEPLDRLIAARDALIERTGLPTGAHDRRTVEALTELTGTLLAMYGTDFGFAFSPDFAEKARAGQRASELLEDYRTTEGELSVTYAPEAARRLDLAGFGADLAKANSRFWFLAGWARKKVARTLSQQGGATALPDVEADLPRLHRLKALLGDLDRMAAPVSGIPGWAGLSSDVEAMATAIELANQLRTRTGGLAEAPEDLVTLRRRVSELVVDANDLLSPDGGIAIALSGVVQELPRFGAASDMLGQLTERPGPEDQWPFHDQYRVAAAVIEHQPRLKAWCDWNRVREEAVAAGLQPLVDALMFTAIDPTDAVEHFETAYARWFAGKGIDAEPRLSGLITDVHMSDIESYRRLEERLSELSVRYVRAKLCGRIPDKNNVGRRDGYGLLKHQLQLQRRHKPVRQLATEMGDAFTTLAPCMLMSPLSIAQYLPPDHALFDLVIFDEASQIAPWDAIGSIARGKQVVIAGDPRQMPPTSFFSRAAGATDDDDATEEDMESILDECLAAGVPQHTLQWHYRSRHESLIAFSNSRYYDNRLITFPAPETRESAVSWRRVDGVYSKGQGRTNQVEAEAMVAETVRRLIDPEFGEAGKTLAIVTLNSDQQRLVEDLLDQARRRNPRIERFFSEDQVEPVVVKNLETVQGDERDLILLGIGYGPTEPGAPTMSMNFGPLNRDGGWRRLNVAVTRAREEMVVFTSFNAAMVDLNRTSARAVRDLKHFIEFAHRGPRALSEAVQGSLGGHESPFEAAVAAALARKGWTVVPQIGVSRFRIDLGIIHPDRPGDYLVGIECDGAAYHSAATARDRDKVRAAILERLGWKLIRVWSTDWWVDKHGATERLHCALEGALEESRTNLPEPDSPVIGVVEINHDDQQSDLQHVELVDRAGSGALMAAMSADVRTEPAPGREPSSVSVTSRTYTSTDFSLLSPLIDPSAFYEAVYDDRLLRLIGHVLEHEAPISESLLVGRIARAHGFQRSGRIIRERVMNMARQHHHVSDVSTDGAFTWAHEQAKLDWRCYRVPSGEADIRPIEEIAPEEIQAAASTACSGDRELEIARLFGVRRLSATARERITRIIGHLDR